LKDDIISDPTMVQGDAIPHSEKYTHNIEEITIKQVDDDDTTEEVVREEQETTDGKTA
jgi:hypothetical protein